MTSTSAAHAPQPIEHPDLLMALWAAQEELRTFEKDSQHDLGFMYSSADGMIADAQLVLRRHGLMMFVADQAIDITQNDIHRGVCKITLVLRHMKTGTEMRFPRALPVADQKGRPLDRGALGAETSMIAYGLRGIFFSARFSDDEMNARDDGAFDPSQIGHAWIDHWLDPTLSRLGCKPDWLRGQLIRAGLPRDQVMQKPWKWPVEWKQRIKEGLSRHSKAPTIEPVPDPDDALGDLPQRNGSQTSTTRKADPAGRAPGRAAPSSPDPENDSPRLVRDEPLPIDAAFGGKPAAPAQPAHRRRS